MAKCHSQARKSTGVLLTAESSSVFRAVSPRFFGVERRSSTVALLARATRAHPEQSPHYTVGVVRANNCSASPRDAAVVSGGDKVHLTPEAKMSSKHEDIVRQFCAAWSRRNVEELLAFFSPDAVYHNMPLPPLQGIDAIRATLETFVTPAEWIEFEMLIIASRGNTVFTERVDRFRFAGKEVSLPVAGVFELENGKIRAWRDYFDMQTWLQQTTPA